MLYRDRMREKLTPGLKLEAAILSRRIDALDETLWSVADTAKSARMADALDRMANRLRVIENASKVKP